MLMLTLGISAHTHLHDQVNTQQTHTGAREHFVISKMMCIQDNSQDPSDTRLILYFHLETRSIYNPIRSNPDLSSPTLAFSHGDIYLDLLLDLIRSSF